MWGLSSDELTNEVGGSAQQSGQLGNQLTDTRTSQAAMVSTEAARRDGETTAKGGVVARLQRKDCSYVRSEDPVSRRQGTNKSGAVVGSS